jgi:TetR/AcrR family transcriptional regulator, tetracycline repressor protein
VSRTRPPLTRDAVLDAALRLIDRSGLDACTMRAVAGELGVEAMSLYWHVASKDALLDGVVERLLAEVEPAPSRAGDWRGDMDAFARDFRAVALRHAPAVPLLASRAGAAYAAAGRMATVGIAELEAAGFDRATAIRAARTVARYVVGFTLAEAGATEVPPDAADLPPALGELIEAVARDDPEELFTFGLETLLDGLEVRLSRLRRA